MAKAAEMVLTGNFLNAEDALATGFLNRIVPAESVLDEATTLAARIAAGPPIAMRLAKSMMQRRLGMDLATALYFSAAAESITVSSADYAEGMAAARDKHIPKYRRV